MPIWGDDLLNLIAVDAQQQINQDLPCIFKRFCLATTAGTAVYTLPAFVRSVWRVNWRGRKLDAVSFDEMMALTPATAGGFYDNSVIGIPLYYCMHPTNPYDVRLFPTPNDTFSDTATDPYSPLPNEASCVVACLRSTDDTMTDPTAMLPPYIDRRTRKAYVLWKAFSSEGKGQNLSAAKYYKAKYDFLISQFKVINSNAYISRRYSLGDGSDTIDNFRYPKPILPSNFERVIFK